jgi:hypothetical protein
MERSDVADHRQLALIHAEIDGELDAEQRGELARCLLADPKVRLLREQLRGLASALDALEQVEPPARLRESILTALPQFRATRPQRYAPHWRHAAVVAGVLATAAVVFETVRGPEPAATDIAGTIAPAGARTLVDTVTLAQGRISGRVSLYRDRTGLGLQLAIVTSAPVDVRIASGGHTLQVNGLDNREQPGGHPTTVALPGFGMDGQSVELTFLMGGQPVGSATLRAPRDE